MPRRLAVGILPIEIDGLVAFTQLRRYSLRCLTARDTAEDRWVSSFLPPAAIVRYSLPATCSSVEQADLSELFTAWRRQGTLRGISHLWLDTANHDRQTLRRWTKKLHIRLIATDVERQQQFENKIWFDRFLGKHGLPKPVSCVQTGRQLSRQLPYRRCVIQHSMSDGGEGTFFVRATAQVQTLLRSARLRASERYLVRQFIAGTAYGITALITPSDVQLSALRVQEFVSAKNSQRHFLGIQWVPGDSVRKDSTKIAAVFKRVGRLLQAEGFIGFANFDFLLDRHGDVHIVECNPRISFSQTHFALCPALLAGLNANQLFFAALLGQKRFRFPRSAGLPVSNFSGAALYLKARPVRGKRLTIRKVFPSGIYRVRAGRVEFVSPDIRRTLRSDECIYVAAVAVGEQYPAWYDMGTIVSVFPLFSPAGRPNHSTRVLERYFNPS